MPAGALPPPHTYVHACKHPELQRDEPGLAARSLGSGGTGSPTHSWSNTVVGSKAVEVASEACAVEAAEDSGTRIWTSGL